MTLFRAIFLSAVKFQCSISFSHIPGYFNIAADALSRFLQVKFFEVHPAADLTATTINPLIWQI